MNVADGEVRSRPGGSERTLRSGDRVERGETVRVGPGARAEILLDPGYYLRLSENAEATIYADRVDDLKVAISGGSAILEVLVADPSAVFGSFGSGASDGLYELVTVVTPRDEIVVASGGLYRLDVSADGSSRLEVASGLAFARGARVEGGTRLALADRAELTGSKSDADDAFDAWSRRRAAELAAHNGSLKKTAWYEQFAKHSGSYFDLDEDTSARDGNEGRTVSVETGLVVFADDGVAVRRRGGSVDERLGEGGRLRDGDAVRTDRSARCEIVLDAASRLYVAGASEAVLATRSDGRIAIEGRAGSVVVVNTLDPKDRRVVAIGAAGVDFEIAEAGEYRLDVAPGGTPALAVKRGSVRRGERAVKAGKRATLASGTLALDWVGKDATDGFDLWCRQRAAGASNDERRLVSAFRRHRAAFGGMWYLDGARGAYTFVPGLLDVRSPYGDRYAVRFRSSYRLRPTDHSAEIPSAASQVH